MGSQRVRHDWATSLSHFTFTFKNAFQNLWPCSSSSMSSEQMHEARNVVISIEWLDSDQFSWTDSEVIFNFYWHLTMKIWLWKASWNNQLLQSADELLKLWDPFSFSKRIWLAPSPGPTKIHIPLPLFPLLEYKHSKLGRSDFPWRNRRKSVSVIHFIHSYIAKCSWW